MAGPSRVSVLRSAGEAAPQIATRALTIAAMVGICERGPIGTAGVPDTNGNVNPVSSWQEWQDVYGGFTANAQALPLAVKGFFDEGGQLLYTGRVVHTTTPGDATTKTSTPATLNLATATVTASAAFVTGSAVGPWHLTASGQFLDVVIDSNGSAQAVFTAVAPHRDSGNGPFALVNNQTLIATVNGVSFTVIFTTSMFVAIGAATAAEVAAAINAKLVTLTGVRAQALVVGSAVRLDSLWFGTGASVNVTGGTANGTLGFTTGALAGTGNVADLYAVTGAEAKSIVEAAVSGCTWTTPGGGTITSNTTGTGSHVQVQGTSTAVAFGFDNAVHTGGAAGTQNTLRVDALWDGTFGNALSPRVTYPAASGAAARFDFDILRGGLAVESWKDASLDPTDSNYIVTLVALGAATQKPSKLVAVVDLAATYPSPSNLPATGTFGPLAGGADGLASLADIDFYGSKANSSATGLHVFDQVTRIDLVAVPGRETAAVANQLATYCDVTREGRCFFVTSVPQGSTVAQARTYVTGTASLKGLSESGAVYGPWIYIDNPNTSVFGTAKTVLAPPEGAILGMMSALDQTKEGGAFQHPAGALGRLRTARGVETAEYEDATLRGLAYDDLLNPIRRERGKPIYLDGSRTLKKAGTTGTSFPSVGESRGAMFVSNQLVEVFGDERHSAINEALYTRLTAAATVFLKRLTDAGAFRSKTYALAFVVDFGAGLNTPDVVEASTVLGLVGLNTSPAAEFIFVTLSPFHGLAAAFAQQTQQQAAA